MEPSSIYLLEEFGDAAEFPNTEGRFNLNHFTVGSTLQVEGRPRSAFATNTQALPIASGITAASFSPTFR